MTDPHQADILGPPRSMYLVEVVCTGTDLFLAKCSLYPFAAMGSQDC